MIQWAMWFSPTTMPGYITAVIAASVGLITYQNWRVSRDKLKLDLYNRRFAIYVSALDCIQDVFETDNPETEKRISLLVRSTRESIFLFDRRDFIFELLSEIREYCQNWATIHRNEDESGKKGRPTDRHLASAMRNDPKNNVLRAEQLLLELEFRLKNYMIFEKLK